MKHLTVSMIFLFFVSGVSFCYEQAALQKKEAIGKKEPKVNFTWGDDVSDSGSKDPGVKKQYRSSSFQPSKEMQPKKVDVKPDKEKPQWIKNIKHDLRKLFLFEE